MDSLVQELAADLGKVSFSDSVEQQFREALASDDVSSVVDTVVGLRRLLARERKPFIPGVRPLIAQLAQLLKVSAEGKLLVELLWIFTNLCSADAADTQRVLDAGALEDVIRLTSFPDFKVAHQAAWCLGNIAGDLRSVVHESGGFDALIALHHRVQDPQHLDVHSTTMWALSNCVRGKPPVDDAAARNALRAAQLSLSNLQAPGSDLHTDCLWVICFTTENEAVVSAVADLPAVLEALMQAVRSDNRTLCIPGLRALGNLASGSDYATQKVLDAGLLDSLLQMLHKPWASKNIQKECMWALSNVAAGSPRQVNLLISHRIMEELPRLMPGANFMVLKEILWIYENLVGNPDHMQKLVPSAESAHFAALARLDVDGRLGHPEVDQYCKLMVKVLELMMQYGGVSVMESPVVERFVDDIQRIADPEVLSQIEHVLTDGEGGLDLGSGNPEQVDPTENTELAGFGFDTESAGCEF